MEKTKSKKNKKDEVSKDVKTNSFVKGPRITEKSAINAERGVYTFNVTSNSNKNEINISIFSRKLDFFVLDLFPTSFISPFITTINSF